MAHLPVPELVTVAPFGPLPGVRWTVRLAGPPFLVHHCPRCEGPRTFHSARAFRVNAHRRRLDVWLLLHCEACSRTRRLPILERVHVDDLDPKELAAFTHNDAHRCDAAALDHGLDAPWQIDARQVPPRFVAVLDVPPGLRVRLDKVLAEALQCSRGEVRARLARGQLVLKPSAKVQRPARTGQQLIVLD